MPHYMEHLEAIHKHLPDGMRGELLRTGFVVKHLPPEDLVMVAGFSDIAHIPNNRCIFVEHGAGQRYTGLDAKRSVYYGGPYPDQVVAYLGPRQAVVDSVGLPGRQIGSPVCDPYDLFGEDSVCAITWHWNARQVCPEADSALRHYIGWLPEIVQALRDQGWEVLGHRHPRLRSNVGMWRNVGVEEVDVQTVRRRASLLIADNTSLAFEMAYLGRQNISLNAPWYRRDVEHGLRFWEFPPGVQADDPDELIDIINHLENHLPRTYSTRAAVGAYDKAFNEGNDGLMAAAWVTAFASSM